MKPIRTLVAPVVITAMAFAGLSAAPARADQTEDIAKLLIGLGAVAIFANALDKKSDNDDRVVTRSRTNREVTRTNRHANERDRRLKYALPRTCLRTYSAGRKDKRLYSGRCLSRLPYNLAKLPKSCAYTIKGSRNDRAKAYGPRCMYRNGFYQVKTVAGKHSRSNKKYDGRHIVYQN